MSETPKRRRLGPFTLPNILTYGRVVAVPVVVACLFWPEENVMRWVALGIFAAAAITGGAWGMAVDDRELRGTVAAGAPVRRGDPLLVLEDVKAGYGDKVVLDGITLSLQSGERIGLLAPLVHNGLLPAAWPYSCNAVTGYSGGGKALIGRFEAEADIAWRGYGLTFGHKHTLGLPQ